MHTTSSKNEYSSYIKNLQKASDEKLAVKLSFDGECLIRDLRSASIDIITPREQENYLINAINTIRACERLSEISGINHAQKTTLLSELNNLFKKIKTFYEEQQDKITPKGCEQILKDTERQAIVLLKQYKIGKNLGEQEHTLLSYARNLTGLEEEHTDILTILPKKDPKSQDQFFAIRSNRICQLTDRQKLQYDHLDQRSWYTSMPPWKKALIKQYKSQLTDGKHVIPTQIRDIPGIRNAYKTEILTLDPDNISGTQKVIYDFSHSGTIASFSSDKQSQTMISSDNLKELEQSIYQGQDKRNLHFFTLNTNAAIDAADEQSVQQTQSAVEIHYDKSNLNKRIIEDEGPKKSHTNAPLNILRLLYNGQYDNLERSLNNLGSLITESNHIHSFLTTNNGVYQKAHQNIKNLKRGGEITERFADILTSAINIKQLITGSKKPQNFFKRWTKNYNVKILEEYTSLQIKLREINEAKDSSEKNILVPSQHIRSIFKSGKDEITNDCFKEEKLHVACKSGKDRTGAMVVAIIKKVIERHLIKQSSVKSVDDKTLANNIIDSGHVQTLAGRSGGTLGCAGTKSLDLVFHNNSPDKTMRRLGREVAQHTVIKDLSSLKNQIIEKVLAIITKNIFSKIFNQSKKSEYNITSQTKPLGKPFGTKFYADHVQQLNDNNKEILK